MGKKATQAEVEQRIKECLKLQLQGYTRADILEYAKETWGLCDSSADIVISRATSRLKEANKASIEETLAVVSANYWQLYREARKQNQIALASSILSQIARIKGVEKYTITHVIEDQRELENATDEDLDAILVDFTKNPD